jgi:hypothetical protein
MKIRPADSAAPQPVDRLQLETDPREQRSAARQTCCTDLQVAFESYACRVAVRAPDISPQGMFINTAQVFPQGSVLKIRFRVGHSGKLIHARAEVRYCLAGVGVGVEFVDISPEDRAAIAEDACAGDDW